MEDLEINEQIQQEEVQEEQTQEDTTEVEFTDSEEKTFTQKELDEILSKRLAREERKFQKKLSEYEEIAQTLKVGMGKEDIDDIKGELKSFYKEQGIEIPNEKDEQILAKAYAKEIIDDGIEEMEKVANKIASIPFEKRTIREKTIFNEVCKELVFKKSEVELEKKGIDPKVIYQDDFKDFASKFSPTTSILEIHEMYSKLNNVVEKPKSTGSVKTIQTDNAVKEFYTPEEARKFTMKDLDNPRLMKALEYSMTKWK